MPRSLRFLLILLALAVGLCSPPREAPSGTRIFDGPSTTLKATRVVPTLETPIERSHSAVWCASFSAVWKSLAEDIAQGDLSLEGSPQTAGLLNATEDPRPHVPAGALYVATGWKQSGMLERIREELASAFPGKAAPTFPGIADEAFVAYSYLEANAQESGDSGGLPSLVARSLLPRLRAHP